MELPKDQLALRQHYFQTLVETVVPLIKAGPDPEVTLEILIAAAAMLREHLETELDALRVEQAD